MNNLAPTQTAIYMALTAPPATYPVYDAVPQGVAKPYIVIGEWTGDWDEELQVSNTDASLGIHTWSGQHGKSQTHAMLQFVRDRLDGQPITGAWLCIEDFNEIMEDVSSTASNRLYHGIARYRVRAEEGAGPASPIPESESVVFNDDGSVTETFSNGLVVTTSFPSTNTIVRVYGAPVSETITTTFNADGSISEVTT